MLTKTPEFCILCEIQLRKKEDIVCSDCIEKIEKHWEEEFKKVCREELRLNFMNKNVNFVIEE